MAKKEVASLARIIVCGHSRIGRKVVEELTNAEADFVLIDPEADKLHGQQSSLIGDATQEHILLGAGVKEADVLITCASTDEINAFIIILAKDLNPNLTILTVGRNVESIELLQGAGADNVVPSSVLGGRSIAKHAIEPQVAEFVDRVTLTHKIQIADIKLCSSSSFSGKALSESKIREETGLSVIAVRQKSGLVPNPKSDLVIHKGDTLIVLGSPEQIRTIMKMEREQ